MLSSTVVKLRALNEGRLPLAMGKYGHAAFLALISQVAPDLAQALHDAGTRQPFTVSPLFGRMQRRENEWHIRPGDSCWMRFTILDPDLYTVFSRYFCEAGIPDQDFTLGTTDFIFEEAITVADAAEWSGFIDYAELQQSAACRNFFTLFFKTPTTFRQGDLDLPLPLPRLVFKGLLAKWNLFSKLPFPVELLDVIERHVGVKEYQIRTVAFHDGHGHIPGFVGKVTFIIKGQIEERVLKEINCLADFAFFAGTGRKTTHGMGMTRRIE